MGLQHCLTEVSKAMGRDVSESEFDQIATALEPALTRYASDGDLGRLSASAKSVGDNIMAKAVLEKRNAALNKVKQAELYDYTQTQWADNPAFGLEAILMGVVKGARQGSRASVANAQGSLFAKHSMGLHADMLDAGVHELFVKGAMDREIWRATHEMDKTTPDFSQLPPEAVTMAKLIRKHSEAMRLLANQHGADIGSIPGYLMKQTHDMGRIYRDQPAWLERMYKTLDWERTFPDVVEDAERLKILEGIGTEFASGVHLTTRDNPTSSLKGFANIGKKMSHERVLHFIDADAEFDYHQAFGAGKLTESVIYGMEKMAQDIGVLQHLGPNAQANLEAVTERLLRDVKRTGDADALKKADTIVNNIFAKFWPHINGQARIPGNHMLADISQGVRAVQMWSKLGGAVLSGISDVPFYAGEVRYQGGTVLGGLSEALGSLASSVPKHQTARLMSMVGVLHDGLNSSATKRFDASDSRPGKMASITSTYFKFNGLRWWTDKLRTGFARARSHDLASQAHKGYADLDNDLKRVLNLYGLDERKWGVLQKGVEEADDGRMYMTPETVSKLDDSVFAALIDKPTPAKIRRLKEEIEGQFRSYFFDRSTTAVIEPDVKTRAYLYGGTRPGTIEGEFMRHLMLFKSFTGAVIQKPLAREIYGRGDMSIKEALTSGNGAIQGVATLLAWNIAFGYLAMSAKDLAKGREPRDPSDWKTFLASAMQGGGFGIYGDLLFGDLKNRYGGGAVSSLMGPTAGSFDSVVDIFQSLRDDEPGGAASSAFRAAVNHTPFINLFYTRLALDYLVLYQMGEMMSPGSLSRMEARMKKENDQVSLMPRLGLPSPSQAVPFGGGDRIFEGVR